MEIPWCFERERDKIKRFSACINFHEIIFGGDFKTLKEMRGGEKIRKIYEEITPKCLKLSKKVHLKIVKIYFMFWKNCLIFSPLFLYIYRANSRGKLSWFDKGEWDFRGNYAGDKSWWGESLSTGNCEATEGHSLHGEFNNFFNLFIDLLYIF